MVQANSLAERLAVMSRGGAEKQIPCGMTNKGNYKTSKGKQWVPRQLEGDAEAIRRLVCGLCGQVDVETVGALGEGEFCV